MGNSQNSKINISSAKENSINFMATNSSLSISSPKQNLNVQKDVKSKHFKNNIEYFAEYEVNFKWKSPASIVYLTGTFTNWRNHILMPKIINEFQLTLV